MPSHQEKTNPSKHLNFSNFLNSKIFSHISTLLNVQLVRFGIEVGKSCKVYELNNLQLSSVFEIVIMGDGMISSLKSHLKCSILDESHFKVNPSQPFPGNCKQRLNVTLANA